MAGNNNAAPRGSYGNVMSTAAAIAAVAVLLKQNKVEASGGFPPEVLQLLTAMAADLNSIATYFANLPAPSGGGGVLGWPPNCDTATAFRVDLQAAGVAQQLDYLEIPDDFALVIKSWPTNPGAGLVFVSNNKSATENARSAYPLVPNEFRSFKVTNANALWVMATVLPASVSISAEIRTTS